MLYYSSSKFTNSISQTKYFKVYLIAKILKFNLRTKVIVELGLEVLKIWIVFIFVFLYFIQILIYLLYYLCYYYVISNLCQEKF